MYQPLSGPDGELQSNDILRGNFKIRAAGEHIIGVIKWFFFLAQHLESLPQQLKLNRNSKES